jgi:hypothetical protein
LSDIAKNAVDSFHNQDFRLPSARLENHGQAIALPRARHLCVLQVQQEKEAISSGSGNLSD